MTKSSHMCMVLVHIWCSKSQNYTAFQRRVYSLNHLWCFAVHICTFLVHTWSRLSTNILDTFWPFLAAASMWVLAWDVADRDQYDGGIVQTNHFVSRQSTLSSRRNDKHSRTPHSTSNVGVWLNRSRFQTTESHVTRLAGNLSSGSQAQFHFASHAMISCSLNSVVEWPSM